jgi:tetratricopeptide (TPR) repeat protein
VKPFRLYTLLALGLAATTAAGWGLSVLHARGQWQQATREGNDLRSVGKLADAELAYLRAMRCAPDADSKAVSLYSLAGSALARGDHARSMGFFAEAVALSPSAEGYASLAHDRLSLAGKIPGTPEADRLRQQAAEDFAAAIRLDPAQLPAAKRAMPGHF